MAVLDLADFRLRVEQAATALAQARARLGVPLDGSDDHIELEKTAVVKQARAEGLAVEEVRLEAARQLVTLRCAKPGGSP